MWDAHIGTCLLHPHVRCNLASHLFIHRASIFGLGELVTHGTTKHEFLTRAEGRDIDRYAHIEPAYNPLVSGGDVASILIAESQVVFGKSRNCVPLLPKLLT